MTSHIHRAKAWGTRGDTYMKPRTKLMLAFCTLLGLKAAMAAVPHRGHRVHQVAPDASR